MLAKCQTFNTEKQKNTTFSLHEYGENTNRRRNLQVKTVPNYPLLPPRHGNGTVQTEAPAANHPRECSSASSISCGVSAGWETSSPSLLLPNCLTRLLQKRRNYPVLQSARQSNLLALVANFYYEEECCLRLTSSHLYLSPAGVAPVNSVCSQGMRGEKSSGESHVWTDKRTESDRIIAAEMEGVALPLAPCKSSFSHSTNFNLAHRSIFHFCGW